MANGHVCPYRLDGHACIYIYMCKYMCSMNCFLIIDGLDWFHFSYETLLRLAFWQDEASESLRAKEISRRKEVEEQLVKEKQEVQKVKNQRDEIMHELQMVQDQNSALKNQFFESQCMVTELEEKIISAVDLLISFREKRDKLRIEHANAVREVKVLKEFRETDTKLSYRVEFPAFSFMEINEATNNFDPSWKIGEGRYGSVYKGLLCNRQVAIKMLPSYGCQSQLEFQHQVIYVIFKCHLGSLKIRVLVNMFVRGPKRCKNDLVFTWSTLVIFTFFKEVDYVLCYNRIEILSRFGYSDGKS